MQRTASQPHHFRAITDRRNVVAEIGGSAFGLFGGWRRGGIRIRSPITLSATCRSYVAKVAIDVIVAMAPWPILAHGRDSDSSASHRARRFPCRSGGRHICRRNLLENSPARFAFIRSGDPEPAGADLKIPAKAPSPRLTSASRGKTLVRRSEEHTSELQSLRHLVCR